MIEAILQRMIHQSPGLKPGCLVVRNAQRGCGFGKQIGRLNIMSIRIFRRARLPIGGEKQNQVPRLGIYFIANDLEHFLKPRSHGRVWPHFIQRRQRFQHMNAGVHRLPVGAGSDGVGVVN